MGVLEGIRVVELAGLAPVPYCGMILSDFGAEVVRVDRTRPGMLPSRPDDPLGRGKRSMRLNLKSPEGVTVLRRLVASADVLLDPYRPGALERLGLAVDELLEKHPRLIVARLTGYGQDGPYAKMAGHDINYIALSGALSLIGRAGEAPVPPANLLADFAGGGLMCAFGITLSLLERHRTGKGQVIDNAMFEGAASLATALHYLRHVGLWQDRQGTNWFDTGAPWYDVYETSDGLHVAVGAFEPQFFAALVEGLGLDVTTLGHSMDPSRWPAMREAFAERFRQKTRDQWCEVFDGTDACVAPVLGLGEMETHPHLRERGALFRSSAGVPQPSPAPKLSRTPAVPSTHSPSDGEHTAEILAELGMSPDETEALFAAGVVKGSD